MKTSIKFTLLTMLFCIFGLQNAKAVIVVKTIKSLGDSCAEIRLFSGQTYSVKVLEIDNLTAKYTTCPKSDGKISSINLTSIYRITMADGAIIYQYKKIANAPVADTTSKKARLKSYTTQQNTNRFFADESKDYNVLALIGFISSALYALSIILAYETDESTLAILGLLLGISGLVCSIIGLVQTINPNSEKKGKGLAIAGLILVALTTFLPFILDLI